MKNIKNHLKFIAFLFITVATAGLKAADAAVGAAAPKVADNAEALAEAQSRMADHTNLVNSLVVGYAKLTKAEKKAQFDAITDNQESLRLAQDANMVTIGARLDAMSKDLDGLKKQPKDLEAKAKFDVSALLGAASGKSPAAASAGGAAKPKPGLNDFIDLVPGSEAVKKYLVMAEKYSMIAYPFISMANVPLSRVPIVGMFSSTLDSWASKVIITSVFIRLADLLIKYKNNKITFADYKENKRILGHILSMIAAYKSRNLTANRLGQTI